MTNQERLNALAAEFVKEGTSALDVVDLLHQQMRRWTNVAVAEQKHVTPAPTPPAIIEAAFNLMIDNLIQAGNSPSTIAAVSLNVAGGANVASHGAKEAGQRFIKIGKHYVKNAAAIDAKSKGLN